ncbi:MAG: MoxR family ATPase [Spirochaetales bacterium]|nr:MoxR family ATPase [Spirochaetales bacterium]
MLIEDIPGVGKTTLARSLAKSAGLDFGRIQFTPDVLPGDIIGMTVWSQEKRDFVFKPGSIMHQFILADEINRASPRTQAALLEAMQEQRVTVDGTTYSLPDMFFVLATQNPVTFAGTFALPEAEIDRFGISFSMGYPAHADEVDILSRFKEENPEDDLSAVISVPDVLSIRTQVRAMHVSAKIKSYLVNIAKSTRESRLVKLGMSPRATQHLMLASQGEALFSGRHYVTPEDVQNVARYVLVHRINLSGEARMENLTAEKVVQQIIAKVPVPTGLE